MKLLGKKKEKQCLWSTCIL